MGGFLAALSLIKHTIQSPNNLSLFPYLSHSIHNFPHQNFFLFMNYFDDGWMVFEFTIYKYLRINYSDVPVLIQVVNKIKEDFWNEFLRDV